MRARCLVAILALFLCVTGSASAASIKLVDLWQSNVPYYHYFWVGRTNIEVAWLSSGLSPQATVKIELLKSGAPFRVLATGVPVQKSGATNSDGQLWGYWVWSVGPGSGDVGCFDSFRVTADGGGPSETTATFGIFDANEFKDSHGNASRVRVDAPVGGVLLRGQTTNIAWSLIAASADTIKLELYYQNAKVGDIGTIPVNPQACPVRGQFPWIVGRVSAVANPAMVPDGKNVIAGNYYEIRASTSFGWYLGGTFVIALTSNKPSPSGTPLHKVGPGTGTIKD
jgi:hypothetical protein